MAQQGDDAGSESYLGAEHRPRGTPEWALGDFTTTPSLLRLVPLGIAVGILAAGISPALLDMIGLGVLPAKTTAVGPPTETPA